MQLKIYVFFLINFLLSSLIFASNPPLPDLDYPHIEPIFDQDDGTLRLRWTDDSNQFLSSARLTHNPKECHRLTHEHFKEIRNEMRSRIQRALALGLGPLNDQLAPHQQMITPLNPLPPVNPILNSIPAESFAKKRTLENQDGQPHAPLTAHLRIILASAKPKLDSPSLTVHEYIPVNSAPFKEAKLSAISSKILKNMKAFQAVWRPNKVRKMTDCSEPG